MTLASSGAEGEAELRVADARRRAAHLDAELARAGTPKLTFHNDDVLFLFLFSLVLFFLRT